MKYHNLHDLKTFTLFNGKSSSHFKELYGLKLLTNDVNLTSFLEGVINYVLNSKFITPGNDIRLTLKFAKSFSL